MINSLAKVLADMPNNMKDNFTHGSDRFTIKNQTTTKSLNVNYILHISNILYTSMMCKVK